VVAGGADVKKAIYVRTVTYERGNGLISRGTICSPFTSEGLLAKASTGL